MHELPEALALGPQDSGLVIENYAKEEAWLSGAQSLGVDTLPWEQYAPAAAQGNLSSCPSSCLAAGHCCVGDVSSYQTPSCAMGCTIAAQSASTKSCMAVCDEANRKVTFKWKNHTFNMADSCPTGCSASDGVGECYQGCAFGLGAPLLDIWQAKLPDSINVTAGFFGLHKLADDDQWHTMLTRPSSPTTHEPFQRHVPSRSQSAQAGESAASDVLTSTCWCLWQVPATRTDCSAAPAPATLRFHASAPTRHGRQ
eukprot:SAG22_NODE_1261_length_4977_cov_9.689832_1_plen_255_part_00